jgi:hypothetical protein
MNELKNYKADMKREALMALRAAAAAAQTALIIKK